MDASATPKTVSLYPQHERIARQYAALQGHSKFMLSRVVQAALDEVARIHGINPADTTQDAPAHPAA